MSEFDYAQRFKKLFHHESNLCHQKGTIAKQTSKYYDGLSRLEAKIMQQFQELKLYQKEVVKLKKSNETLSKFLDEEQLRLQSHKNRIDELHQKTITKKDLLIRDRQKALKETEILRCYKSCTQTFINTRRLPESIQGVVVCEKETSSQLKPFQMDPQQHTHQEVMDMLWRLTEPSETFNDNFHDLIIGYFGAMTAIPSACEMNQKSVES